MGRLFDSGVATRPHPSLPRKRRKGVKVTLSQASSQVVAIPKFMVLNAGEKLATAVKRGARTRCASYVKSTRLAAIHLLTTL